MCPNTKKCSSSQILYMESDEKMTLGSAEGESLVGQDDYCSHWVFPNKRR